MNGEKKEMKEEKKGRKREERNEKQEEGETKKAGRAKNTEVTVEERKWETLLQEGPGLGPGLGIENPQP